MGPQASNIGDLPTEILRLVFVHAYLGSRHKFRAASSKHARCLRLQNCGSSLGKSGCKCTLEEKAFNSEWRNDDLTKSDIFPYPIASVCQRWRNIMESIPIFWTRVVAFIDSRTNPLSRVEKQLRLSQDLLLDVFVLRHPGTYNVVDTDENARCRAIIDLVMPHLHRCRSITFNTLYTSSLPSISRDFCGLTLALTSLTLTASVDDEKPSGDWSSHSLPPSHANPFSCPNLCKIDIDGRNFVHACLDLPSWRASLKDTSRDDRIRLSLSKFTPSSGKDREFTMDDVLAFLTELSLYELTLTEIEFYVDMHIAGPAVAAQVPGNMVSLVGLNARFMTLLLNSIEFDDMEYLNVESCDLRVPESDLFGASAPATVLYNLILQDIDAGGDIAGFLRSFPGYALDVVRCPGFDDRALSVLASPEWEGPITLSFCDCDGFSVRGIIRMLEALAAANTDGYGRRVNSLTVEGRGPPAPTEEERKKIEQYVSSLCWYATEALEGEDVA